MAATLKLMGPRLKKPSKQTNKQQEKKTASGTGG